MHDSDLLIFSSIENDDRALEAKALRALRADQAAGISGLSVHALNHTHKDLDQSSRRCKLCLRTPIFSMVLIRDGMVVIQ